MADITEAQSLAIYETAIRPAFEAYQEAGATDEAFAEYSAIVNPLWDEHLARIGATQADDEDTTEPDTEPNGEGDPAPDYDSHTKAELVAIAEERGIDASGTKADLVERLQADDEDTDTE